jgi:hypothetical protein
VEVTACLAGAKAAAEAIREARIAVFMVVVDELVLCFDCYKRKL